MSKNIVFVDSRVTDYQTLVAGLSADTVWLVLNANSDGVQQMQAALTGFSALDSIQIVSHGSPGALYLGSTLLSGINLSAYQQQLASIGSALSSTGDILLYGCNVAQGDVGAQFIASLAQYTGADVAASVDATGAAALGGDWVLEASVGQVDAVALNVTADVGVLGVNLAPTFVADYGKVTTDFGSYDQAYDVVLQTDGKILVTGVVSGSYFGFARYNVNGSLDTTFDTDGKLSTGIIGKGSSVVWQADGKIVAAGDSFTSPTLNDFAVVRYNANGTPDTSFGLGGKSTLDFGSNDHGESVALQSDGKILVAGYTGDFNNADFALARYNIDGSLDASFAIDGKLTTDFGAHEEAHSIAVQLDGKILVAGYTWDVMTPKPEDFAIARYNLDGSLDSSFDGDGKLITNLGNGDVIFGIKIQLNGKILAAGRWGNDFGLVRYNTDGSLDTSFNADGKVLTDFGSTTDWGYSVTTQDDGKILVAGMSAGYDGYSCDFALVRYNTDGSLDTTFDGDGKLTTNFETGSQLFGDWAYSVTVQPDGKIVAVGRAGTVNGQYDFALARYSPDGSLDTSFGGGISSLNPTASYTENAAPIVLDSSIHPFDAELALANDFAGASVALQRQGAADPQDIFSSAVGSGVSALTQGSVFTVDGITVGQVTANSGGRLELLFTTGATQTLVDKALSNIAYSNSSDAPTTSVALDWTLNDGNSGAQGTGGALASMAITTVTITPVNDAPTGSVTITSTPTQGQTLTASNTLADPDGPATLHLNYQWAANGSPIAGASNSSFVPGQAEVGKTITVTAGYTDNNGMAESVASSASAAVANVNDAPTLDSTASPALPSIVEGATNPAGITVASLIADGSVSDLDGTAVEAIAITALNTSLGSWQYSLSGGTTWLTVRADLINSATNELALLLGSTAQLRLLPFGDLNGSLADAMTMRAWDMSSGGQGDYVDTLGGGGTSAFSTVTDTASLAVTAVNDAPTFAPVVGTGKVTTDIGGPADYATSMAVQADGKIVVAGSGYGGNTLGDFALVRYNSDGSLDTTFSGDGKVTTDIDGSSDAVHSVTMQSDGKIVVAGFGYIGGNADLAVARYNSDGSPDTSFSGDGKLTIDTGGDDRSQSATVQSDGKLLVAGSGWSGSNGSVVLVRLNIDGVLDTSFDTDGIVTTDIGSSYDGGQSVTVQADGKILVAGHSYNGGNAGYINSTDIALIRYNIDGSLDTTFSGDGMLTTDFGSYQGGATSVTAQSDGKILVAGYTYTSTSYYYVNFALVRYNADGSLDTSFSGDGKLTTSIGGLEDLGYSVTIQADGKIVMVGSTSSTGSTSNAVVVRLNADGSLDASFGQSDDGTPNGVVNLSVGDGNDFGKTVILQADGKILLAGDLTNGTSSDIWVARLMAN